MSIERQLRAETWLVVCEGTKTEPNYFISLFDYVNNISTKKIKYKVEGTGKNTQSLVKSVDNFFSFSDELVSKIDITYGKVFVVFDKNDFEADAFNNAINNSIKKGYIPLWSNECIELWFLLHFSYFTSIKIKICIFQKIKIYDKILPSFLMCFFWRLNYNKGHFFMQRKRLSRILVIITGIFDSYTFHKNSLHN